MSLHVMLIEMRQLCLQHVEQFIFLPLVSLFFISNSSLRRVLTLYVFIALFSFLNRFQLLHIPHYFPLRVCVVRSMHAWLHHPLTVVSVCFNILSTHLPACSLSRPFGSHTPILPFGVHSEGSRSLRINFGDFFCCSS